MENNEQLGHEVDTLSTHQEKVSTEKMANTSDQEEWSKLKESIAKKWHQLPPEEQATMMVSQLRFALAEKKFGDGTLYDLYDKFVNEVIPPHLRQILSSHEGC
jgi:hypothetical protein